MTFFCRSCGSTQTEPVLSLGRTPLANALLHASDLGTVEPTFPLDLVLCTGCSLVQITQTVPPEQLFRDYKYFSSFSDAMVEHAGELAKRLIEKRHLNRSRLVVELASNDGYLLQHYVKAGIPVLGIEPAVNVAKAAAERGVRTIVEFFGNDLAKKLVAQGERASIIHANNVAAHVADINGFVAGIATLLRDDGIAVIETPYVRDMIDRCEFDTIYHEHLFYYSLHAFKTLAARHGLAVVDVERLPIHGGSLRIFVAREAGQLCTENVFELLHEEAQLGVGSIGFYRDFATRVQRLKSVLTGLVLDLKSAKRHIAAYGAAAKGATLLNYCGIDASHVDFVVDRNGHKHGLHMPGSHIPICPPSVFRTSRPDYCLLLTWNFAAEILEQQREYTAGGGRFILPVPDVRIV
jgi:SAM-dependent methyltransferase